VALDIVGSFNSNNSSSNMDIIVYQNNTGSAPAINWWLSQELNIGPELYAFNDGYCRPRGHHVGGVVIEDSQSSFHEKHRKSLTLLESEDQQTNNLPQSVVVDGKLIKQQPVHNGIIDVTKPFIKDKSKFDYFVWSNYGGNLINPETIIKADKTLLVDNSVEEQMFFYISQYAFAWIETPDDIIEQTESWIQEHTSIENWKEAWYKKHHNAMMQKWKDGDLKYMWQLNFAHNDLRTALENGDDNIEFINADDHERLFEVKNQKEDFTETLFSYTNKEVDHIIVGDDWFTKTEDIMAYLGIVNSFRLKKYLIDYIKVYKQKKQLYTETFSKYL
jgi:hypothetical protein